MRLTKEGSTDRLQGDTCSPATLVWLVATLMAALLFIFVLDRATGDAPVQHLYYLPILLASNRFGLRGGLSLAALAIALYHLASPLPLAWTQPQADVLQTILFIAMAVVTARLADDRRRLRHLAITDDLTGLHNLRSFESRLMQMVRECQLAGVPLAMLVLDLDRLKPLNDRYGHLAGADAVRTLGEVIGASIPPKAVACRFGGDEFAVAIPDYTEVAADAIAQEIRRGIKALAPSLARQAFPAGALSVSVGVACLSFLTDRGVLSAPATDVDTAELLFRAADRGLYIAKEQGRDRVSVVTLSSAASMRSAR